MTGSDVTFLTLTIPGREPMLARCVASVYAQTVRPFAHLVLAEAEGKDVGRMYNLLVKAVTTPWIHFLDDDNYLKPYHLERLLLEMEAADVVYSWEESETRARVNFNDWSPEKIIEYQDRENAVDNSCAVRVTSFWKAGGFIEDVDTPRDWLLFKEMARQNARFRCVPEVTWRYTQHEYGGKLWDARELRKIGVHR